MSQILNPSSGGGGGSGIQTINGDIGSITGSAVTIYANNAINQEGSSVKFVNSGTISTLELTDSLDNIMIGTGAGNLTKTGADNVGVGTGCLQGLTSGSINSGFGSSALADVTTGGSNCALGNLAGAHITTGSFNITLGSQSGQNYVSSEFANICIQNNGVTAENNTIRLGTNGAGAAQQNRCFVAGIQGVTTAQPGVVTINTTTGQLANVAAGTSGNVLTSNGTNWTSAPAAGGSPPTLSVAMNTDQALTQNALVDVVYDTVMVDTAGGYAAGVYTVPTTGNWFVSIVSVFKSTVTFINCDIFLNKNSGTFIYHGQPCMSVSDPSVVTVNGGSIFPLVAGDTLKLSVFAQTTGATNYVASGMANGYYNIFSAYRVS